MDPQLIKDLWHIFAPPIALGLMSVFPLGLFLTWIDYKVCKGQK